MASICVVVDNQNLQNLVSTTEGASGSLPLTTLQPDQRSARIEVQQRNGSENRELYVLEIDGLQEANPELDVRGWIRRGVLHLEFDLAGKTFHRKAIDLPKRRTGRLWMVLPALLVVVFAGLIFLPFGADGGGSEQNVADDIPVTDPLQPAEVGATEQSGTEAPAATGEESERTMTSSHDAGDAERVPAPDTGAVAVSGTAPTAGAATGTATEAATGSTTEPAAEPADEAASDTAGTLAAAPAAASAAQPIREIVYFAPDNAALSPEAMAVLEELLPRLAADSGADAASGEDAAPRMEITGHCALAGTERGRIDLSFERAYAVLGYLRSLGWEPADEPLIRGMGGSQPVALEWEMQHLNRRVEISTTGG